MNCKSLASLRGRMVFPISVLILSITACAHVTDATGPDVDLTTDRTSYAWGDEGLLTLTNLHGNAVQVVAGDPESGICGLATLERRTESGWTPEDLGCVRVMVLQYRELADGATISERFEIAGLAFHSGGEYRFAVGIRDAETGGEALYSNAFTIQE